MSTQRYTALARRPLRREGSYGQVDTQSSGALVISASTWACYGDSAHRQVLCVAHARLHRGLAIGALAHMVIPITAGVICGVGTVWRRFVLPSEYAVSHRIGLYVSPLGRIVRPCCHADFRCAGGLCLHRGSFIVTLFTVGVVRVNLTLLRRFVRPSEYAVLPRTRYGSLSVA